MDDYNNLVSRILNNDCLASCVEELSEENLNLVSTDWISRLDNDATFQNFSQNPKSFWRLAYSTENYQCETSMGPKLYTVLVGYCKFVKPFDGKACKPGLIVLDSEPLTKIARALMSDLYGNTKISNDFKFNFNECGILGCSDCRKCADMFGRNGYNVTRLSQPCIVDTRVFDGKNVVNRFLSQMECMFSQRFLAIMLLEIDSRYSYFNNNREKIYRITGNVLHVVGLNETRLMASKKVDIGPLTTFESTYKDSKDKKPKSSKNDCYEEMVNCMTETKTDLSNNTMTKRKVIADSEFGNLIYEIEPDSSDDKMPNTKRKLNEYSELENLLLQLEPETDLSDDKMANAKRKVTEYVDNIYDTFKSEIEPQTNLSHDKMDKKRKVEDPEEEDLYLI